MWITLQGSVLKVSFWQCTFVCSTVVKGVARNKWRDWFVSPWEGKFCRETNISDWDSEELVEGGVQVSQSIPRAPKGFPGNLQRRAKSQSILTKFVHIFGVEMLKDLCEKKKPGRKIKVECRTSDNFKNLLVKTVRKSCLLLHLLIKYLFTSCTNGGLN